MTHNHEHHCFHDLRYCSVCDKCYCAKCNREWGKHNYCWTNTGTWMGGSTFGSSTGGTVGTGITNMFSATSDNKMNAVASTTPDIEKTVEVHTHQEQNKKEK